VYTHKKDQCQVAKSIIMAKKFHIFFGTSPSSSFTSELLMSMLKFMDDLYLFDHSVCKPFLMLDGHGSRMQLPF
jgi:hypothetical protein